MALSVELHKKFKEFQMDVAFEHDGGSLGILGGSGMGKSMTLKMIAGLVKPDSGKVIVDGRTVYDSTAKIDMPARERHIGYLFQQYALFPTMTVAENIGIAMKKRGDEKKKEIDRLLEQFALQNLGGRMPNELSGGQQQRVALARILASEPQMLLLDEPFSALDSFLKEQLLEKNLGERLLLPSTIVKSDEDLFLDDYRVGDLETALQTPVNIVKSSGRAFVEALLMEDGEVRHSQIGEVNKYE